MTVMTMRNGKWIGLAILIFLTVMTVIPVNVIGPFDVRTSEPAVGVRLEYSPAGAVLEPIMALAHIITGAPDSQAAAISISAWLIGLVAFVAAVSRLKGSHWRINRRTIIITLTSAGSALFMLVVYGMFIVMVRVPNWRAVAENPDIVLAELQTHTFSSYDGLISAQDNLRWQKQRGCNIVAIIEHRSPEGCLEETGLAESDESMPAVLPGVEIDLDELGYVIAIGSREQFLRNTFDSHQKFFIRWFHQTYDGILLENESHLKTGMAEQAAEAGVDGFGVANDGHPDMPAAVRTEILAVSNSHHLPLVAWTDWHGIGSILRTWTAIVIPNVASLSRRQLSAAVLDTLRRHDSSNITPLVVGRMGQVSLARAIFAPFIESIRYALGLSAARLLGWWVWGIALFLVATILLRLGIRPQRLFSGAAMFSMGIAIVIEGLQLLIAHFSGQAPYQVPFRVGLAGLVIGTAAVLCGIIDASFAIIRRNARTPR